MRYALASDTCGSFLRSHLKSLSISPTGQQVKRREEEEEKKNLLLFLLLRSFIHFDTMMEQFVIAVFHIPPPLLGRRNSNQFGGKKGTD